MRANIREMQLEDGRIIFSMTRDYYIINEIKNVE